MTDFKGFNNFTGSERYLVPNIIHYLRFNKTTFSLVDYICIRSAYVNHNPELIIFHTNVDMFRGEFWEKITKEPGFYARIRIEMMQVPSEIYGNEISKK